MKFRLYLPVLAVGLLFGFHASSLQAQSDDNASAGAGAGARLSFLSHEDKVHLYKVRKQVLESNPDLKTEQESLSKEREFVKGKGAAATADDKKVLFQNFMAHSQKMQAAMRQQDPTIGPVLDQIDAKMQQRVQQKTGDTAGN